ncbi:benzoate transporter [Kaistia sp. 32K]|uniref:benzoate/H(+) symporter BenE family transporter n=1 Tax=Kaistia sp. 32K TaxID=2795690 RepID=UPI001915A6FE|nr:benzoate/H(+) symporter BenE family transporter [Kaistia sp. 32K]BCP53297.1 benzoate transporter [Kaistia sp. 32K]
MDIRAEAPASPFNAPERSPAETTGTSPSVGLTQPIVAGIMAAFVGFAGVFTVVLQGLVAVGATQAQAASGLLAICVAQGLLSIFLSWRYRIPVSIAWSTPGSVLFAATGIIEGGFPAAVGAFILAGLLIVAAGLIKPFGRLVSSIPAVLASAMLAGILLGLCLAPARAVGLEPALAIPVVVVWALVGRIRKIWAVPAAVATAVALIVWTAPTGGWSIDHITPDIAFVWPVFTLQGLVSLAIPLFIVTMASQNLPGIAVMKANGYEPPVGPVFFGTGVASMLVAPFGGHTLNFAALTAAMCAGPDAHPEPSRRWIASVSAGAFYLLLGLGATLAAALVTVAPPVLIQAATGLALLGAFAGALAGAISIPAHRDAAMVTFVTAASGLSFYGIGAAFWGLIAGGAFMLLNRNRSR